MQRVDRASSKVQRNHSAIFPIFPLLSTLFNKLIFSKKAINVTICNKLKINYEDRTGGEALEIGDHLIKYHLEC